MFFNVHVNPHIYIMLLAQSIESVTRYKFILSHLFASFLEDHRN